MATNLNLLNECIQKGTDPNIVGLLHSSLLARRYVPHMSPMIAQLVMEHIAQIGPDDDDMSLDVDPFGPAALQREREARRKSLSASHCSL